MQRFFNRYFPTLPTLRECSSTGWAAGNVAPPAAPTVGTLDFWTNAAANRLADDAMMLPLGYTSGTRVADDVILTNVIGFDVKAWDPQCRCSRRQPRPSPSFVRATNSIIQCGVRQPGRPLGSAPVNGITYTLISFGAYADLGYGNAAYGAPLAGSLSHWGHPKSHLDAAATTTRVYDTYSTHYETVALTPQPTGTTPGQAVNGFDDDGDGIVDDIVYNGVSTAGENITAPPYPIPLRGIQVKIRVFEPDSRQVREVTVVQDFLTQ